MDFLKILLSTLILAVITALVFFAMYFLFPDVAESQFGVSVNYAPERVPTVRSVMAEEAAEGTVVPPPAEKKESAPAPVKEAPVKKEGKAPEAPAPAVKETEPEPRISREEEIEGMLTDGGKIVRDFVDSAKMQVVLALIPGELRERINADPEGWSDSEVEQINKIGDYLVEHDIDIDKEMSVVKLPKLMNQISNGTLPDYLQDFVDFLEKEVQL